MSGVHPPVGAWPRHAGVASRLLGLLAALGVLVSQGGAQPRFVAATASSGIDFVHEHGGFGRKFPTETMGSGVALFDYDGDGWLDLYVVNYGSANRLFRNAAAGKAAGRGAKPHLVM